MTRIGGERVNSECCDADGGKETRGGQHDPERYQFRRAVVRTQRRGDGTHEFCRRRRQPVQGCRYQEPHQRGEDRYPDHEIKDDAAQQDDQNRGQGDARAGRQIIPVLAKIAQHGALGLGPVGLARVARIIAAVGERCRIVAGSRGPVRGAGRAQAKAMLRKWRRIVVAGGIADRGFGGLLGRGPAGQPGQRTADVTATGDRREIVEAAQEIMMGQRLKHAQCKGRGTDAASGKRDPGQVGPGFNARIGQLVVTLAPLRVGVPPSALNVSSPFQIAEVSWMNCRCAFGCWPSTARAAIPAR